MAKITIIQTTLGIDCPVDSIKESLVKAKLCVCAYHTTIKSTYQWQHQLQNEDEYLLTIKTLPNLREICGEKLLELHPYEIPMVTYSETEVNQAYYEWAIAQVTI